jgi:hypothetical protein
MQMKKAVLVVLLAVLGFIALCIFGTWEQIQDKHEAEKPSAYGSLTQQLAFKQDILADCNTLITGNPQLKCSYDIDANTLRIDAFGGTVKKCEQLQKVWRELYASKGHALGHAETTYGTVVNVVPQ